jgi:hypothetical protein
MNTSEVLNKAADTIQLLGWKQGPAGMDATGLPVCAMGAIGHVIGAPAHCDWFSYYEIEEHPAYAALRDYLNLIVGVEIWNDSQASAETVIATLRAAAVIEAAKESASEQVSA